MKRWAVGLMVAGLALAGPLYGEDDPRQLVSAGEQTIQQNTAMDASPLDRWQAFLESQGWSGEMAGGGVLILPDRDLIISSASSTTSIRLGQPGWIESRVAAFERAEMDAKGKIVRFLAETAESRRSLSMIENAVWQDGDVDKARELQDVADTLRRIGRKTLDLAEGKLDEALKSLDPDYDPEKYRGKSQEELRVIVEDRFNRQVRALAMKTLIGATTVFSAEGAAGDAYEVVVGVVWSPKLNRLAVSLFNDTYNIPAVQPGKSLTEHVPESGLVLLGTLGTRIVIDENGQYAVLAFGQAQPRNAGPSRRQQALYDATQIAANRARAHMVNFIGEGMTLRETESSEELLREFSDMDMGAEFVRDYRKIIDSQKTRVTLKGLRAIREWHLEHPASGQLVAGTVIAWTPASADLSRKAAEMMQPRADGETPPEAAVDARDSRPAAPAIQSMPVDTSAY